MVVRIVGAVRLRGLGESRDVVNHQRRLVAVDVGELRWLVIDQENGAIEPANADKAFAVWLLALRVHRNLRRRRGVGHTSRDRRLLSTISPLAISRQRVVSHVRL